MGKWHQLKKSLSSSELLFIILRYVRYKLWILFLLPFINICLLKCASNISVVWLSDSGITCRYSQSSLSPVNEAGYCGRLVCIMFIFVFIIWVITLERLGVVAAGGNL